MQGIYLFQAVYATLANTDLPFKLQTVYLWIPFFLCISDMQLWIIIIRGKYYQQDLIMVLKSLQGIYIFQAIASTLADTVFLFKPQTVYL